MAFHDLSLEMGARLKKEREQKGKELKGKPLSHEALSKELEDRYDIKISKDSLMNYEVSSNNHSKQCKNLGMRVEYLHCLSDFYGVSSDYLMGRTPADIRTPDIDKRAMAEKTGLSIAAIDALCEITDLDNAFLTDEDEPTEIDHYMKPSTILNELLSSKFFYQMILDLMKSRSYVHLMRTMEDEKKFFEDMTQAQKERYMRKTDELYGWADHFGLAVLSGEKARDMYIEKAADALKEFERSATVNCQNEINALRERRQVLAASIQGDSSSIDWSEWLDNDD